MLLSCRHPFDSSKWGRICQFLTNEDVLDKNRIVEPLEASKDDLLVVGIFHLHVLLLLLLVNFCDKLLIILYPFSKQVHPESYLGHLKCSANVAVIIEVNHIHLARTLKSQEATEFFLYSLNLQNNKFKALLVLEL